MKFAKMPVHIKGKASEEKYVYINPLLVSRFESVEEPHTEHAMIGTMRVGDPLSKAVRCTKIFFGERDAIIVALSTKRVETALNNALA